jgi:hypothetical protein
VDRNKIPLSVLEINTSKKRSLRGEGQGRERPKDGSYIKGTMAVMDTHVDTEEWRRIFYKMVENIL